MLSPTSSTVKVLINYPSLPVIAFGLKALLAEIGDFDVQCLCHTHERWRPEAADVVVTEYNEDLSGRRPVRYGGGTGSRLLVVAADERERDIRSALQRGITGFVLLRTGADDLIEAVRAVNRGQTYLSSAVARCLAESVAHESLTRRESEVLQLVSDGACNKQIATELDIAVATVKAHVKSVMEKLEASSRTQAARIASKRGLVDDRLPKFAPSQKAPLSLM